MIISIQLVFFYYFDFFAVKQELDFELKLQLLQIDLLLLLQCNTICSAISSRIVSASDSGSGFVLDPPSSFLSFALKSVSSLLNLSLTLLWSLAITLNPSCWFTPVATSFHAWPDSCVPCLNL